VKIDHGLSLLSHSAMTAIMRKSKSPLPLCREVLSTTERGRKSSIFGFQFSVFSFELLAVVSGQTSTSSVESWSVAKSTRRAALAGCRGSCRCPGTGERRAETGRTLVRESIDRNVGRRARWLGTFGV
jgi:hypothetical protein